MKIKSAFKYQISDVKKPIIIYYIVIASLLLLTFIIAMWTRSWNGVSVTVSLNQYGFGNATLIFLFILGLNAHRSTFHMLIANGISRKTMFLSFALLAAAVSIGMMVIDILIGYIPVLIVGSFANVEANLTIDNFGMRLLWMFARYLGVIAIGYLITVLYYRMNKAVKLLVSIGVPVFFLIILPLFDMVYFSGVINAALWDAVCFLVLTDPLITIVASAALGGLAYIALRRAPVKA